MSATNRGAIRRENDFYATPAWCVRALLRTVQLPGRYWLEPAVGDGAIVKAVNEMLPEVHWVTCDIVNRLPADLARRCWLNPVGRYDANGCNQHRQFTVVITNPPYSQALEFVKGGLKDGKIVVMLLRLNWLSGQKRNQFLREHTPSVYVLPRRPSFTGGGTDATDYAWFVWGMDETPKLTIIDMEDCK